MKESKKVLCIQYAKCVHRVCPHHAPHIRECYNIGTPDVNYCTQWFECFYVDKKVRCIKGGIK